MEVKEEPYAAAAPRGKTDGKTHIIREFGAKHYKNSAYINLETDLISSTWFDDNIDPKRIVILLEAHIKERIVPKKTPRYNP